VSNELTFSLRNLRRSPGFALTAICTFALAIGTSTAVFSVVNRVLLQPPPISDPDRVMVMWARERGAGTVGEISHSTFRAWQEKSRSFESLAAMGSVNWSLVLRENGEPATLPIAAVSASFFPMLRTTAVIGRTLLPEDDRRGAADVAVLSHASWVRRFGADPAVVGRRLMLSGRAYTVVGVMPERFDYPRSAELWVPVVPQLAYAATSDFEPLEVPWFGVLYLIGRLEAGVTMSAARGELAGFMAQDEAVFPRSMEPVLTPLPEHMFGKTRPALLAIAGGVGLVWLIACANIAVLLLVRAASRRQEAATLAAIGATRWQISRRAFLDALILSAVGGVLGVVFARWTIAGLVALAPPEVLRLETVAIDERTLLFAWIACLATGLLVGGASAWYTGQSDPADALRAAGARLTRPSRLRRGFVVAQVGLALTLLVAAGLVVRSFANLLNLDLGFNPTNVLTLDIVVPDVPPERHAAFYTALLERVRAMPGVEATGAIFLRPLEHTAIGTDGTILIEGQRVGLEYREWEKNPLVNYETVTPDYFRAMGMLVRGGRAFTDADTANAPQVVIVSETLARRLWPGEDAIGKRMTRPGLYFDMKADPNGPPRWATVVGVVEAARYRGLTDVRFDLYIPYLQRLGDTVKHVMVRTANDPVPLVPAIRAAARELEPTVLVEGVRTMDQIVGRAMSPWQFSATTLGILSAFALTLAVLGVYGSVSESVVQRRREIAIRSTLGALPRDIVRLVVREGVLLTAIGIAAGLTISIGVSRALAGLLFGVRPLDPATLAGTAALFVCVSLAAMLLPVGRALHVDPTATLKQE
jgi:predicted permease